MSPIGFGVVGPWVGIVIIHDEATGVSIVNLSILPDGALIVEQVNSLVIIASRRRSEDPAPHLRVVGLVCHGILMVY